MSSGGDSHTTLLPQYETCRVSITDMSDANDRQGLRQGCISNHLCRRVRGLAVSVRDINPACSHPVGLRTDLAPPQARVCATTPTPHEVGLAYILVEVLSLEIFASSHLSNASRPATACVRQKYHLKIVCMYNRAPQIVGTLHY